MVITVQYPIFDGRDLFNVQEVASVTASIGNVMYTINGESRLGFLNKIGPRREGDDGYCANRAVRFPHIENSKVKLGSKSFSPQVESRIFKSVKNFESFFEITFFHHIKKLLVSNDEAIGLVKNSFLKTCLSLESSIPSSSNTLSSQSILNSKNKVKELYYYATTPKNLYSQIIDGVNERGKHSEIIGSKYIAAGLPIAILETEIESNYKFEPQSLVCEIGGDYPVRVHQLTSNTQFASWLITYENMANQDFEVKDLVKKLRDYILFVHRFNESREFLCRFTENQPRNLLNTDIRNKALKLIDTKLAKNSYFNKDGAFNLEQEKIFAKILFPTEEKVNKMIEHIQNISSEFDGLNLFERLLMKDFYLSMLYSLKDEPYLFNSVLTFEELNKAIKRRDIKKIKELIGGEMGIAVKLFKRISSLFVSKPTASTPI